MERKRLNTTLSGYHLLMILSAVDFRFHPKEDLVIKDFLVSEFPFTIDLDKQMEVISRLLPDGKHILMIVCTILNLRVLLKRKQKC
jgi:hypothetical protein